MHEIGSKRGQSIVLSVSPAIVQRAVSAFDESGMSQAWEDHGDEGGGEGGGTGAEYANHWHRRLLPAPRQRPGRRRAAEQRDEMAASFVEHGLPSRNPLCQLTAGSGLLGS